MNPTYLWKDEVLFELRIRGIHTGENTNVDTLRPLLREMINLEPDSTILTHPDVQFDFEEQLAICQRKLIVFEGMVNIFQSDKKHIDFKRIMSRILHLKSRLNYISSDSAHITLKNNLLSQTQALILKLEQKAHSHETNLLDIGIDNLESDSNSNPLAASTESFQRPEIINSSSRRVSFQNNNINNSSDQTFIDEASNSNQNIIHSNVVIRTPVNNNSDRNQSILDHNSPNHQNDLPGSQQNINRNIGFYTPSYNFNDSHMATAGSIQQQLNNNFPFNTNSHTAGLQNQNAFTLPNNYSSNLYSHTPFNFNQNDFQFNRHNTPLQSGQNMPYNQNMQQNVLNSNLNSNLPFNNNLPPTFDYPQNNNHNLPFNSPINQPHIFFNNSDFNKIPPFNRLNLKFNGKNQSLHSFLEKIEEFCLAHKISKDTLLSFAHEFFENETLIWFRSVRTNISSWDELVYQLKLDFLPIDYELSLWDEIRSRTQGSTERPLIFIAIMENLFKRCINPVAEFVQLKIIIRNLLPYYQQQLSLRQPVSILELKTLCRMIEDTKIRSEKYQSPPLCNANTLEPELAFKKPFLKHFQKTNISLLDTSNEHSNNSQNNCLQPNFSNQNSLLQDNLNSINSKIKCYNCDEFGHAYQKCTQKKNIFCYTCGKKNVIKPKCPSCQLKNPQTTAQVSAESVINQN